MLRLRLRPRRSRAQRPSRRRSELPHVGSRSSTWKNHRPEACDGARRRCASAVRAGRRVRLPGRREVVARARYARADVSACRTMRRADGSGPPRGGAPISHVEELGVGRVPPTWRSTHLPRGRSGVAGFPHVGDRGGCPKRRRLRGSSSRTSSRSWRWASAAARRDGRSSAPACTPVMPISRYCFARHFASVRDLRADARGRGYRSSRSYG